QAEDGIRDFHVTGVKTCALPICGSILQRTIREAGMTTAVAERRQIGELLREWRNRRRISQLELSLQAEVSSRHLSFVETGRSRPSREMVLRLGDCLGVPLRE